MYSMLKPKYAADCYKMTPGSSLLSDNETVFTASLCQQTSFDSCTSDSSSSNVISSSYRKMPIDTRVYIPSHGSLLRQTMDDIYPIDSLFKDEHLFDELFELIRHGHIAELKRRLDELSNAMGYLTTSRWYGKEQLSFLMVAALHGQDEIVRLLLTCDALGEQVDLRGTILKGNRKIMKGVNALFCACYRGHFHVAKTLIELGKADVNAVIPGHSHHPWLLYAASDNRLDIVRFLVENRYADVNETKSYDYRRVTALMCAVRNGHTNLVQYLIDAGANVHYCPPYTDRGKCALLMIAVKKDQLEVFVLLHQYGVKIDRWVLWRAVEYESQSILRYLLDKSLITPDQLELTTATSVYVSSEIAALRKKVRLLRISLEYRRRTGQIKVSSPSLSIYDHQRECRTVDELEKILSDRDRIFIEFLLINERLQLSQHSSDIFALLLQYSLRLVSKKRFDTCLDMCHRHFELQERYDADSSLHLFIWLICEMLSFDHRLSIDRFLQVAHLIFKPSYQKHTEQSVSNALFMVILATKMLEQEKTTADDRRAIYKWVHDLCQLNLRMSSGENLILLCVNEETNQTLNFRSATTKTHIKFPNEAGLRLLLTYASRWLDIDAMGSQGSTPLHIACRQGASSTMIELLVHYGSHLDSVDIHGRTAVSYAENESIIDLLTSPSKVDQLKCLCARLITKDDLENGLKDLLPSKLNKFVSLHDARRSHQMTGSDSINILV